MNAKEILVAARKLIEKEENWTKGGYARNSKGLLVADCTGPEAVCWCALGALRNVTKTGPLDYSVGAGARFEAIVKLLELIPRYDGLAEWQDEPERTHAEVLALFDKAISNCEAAI